MPKPWERQEKAVAELAKVINLKSPCWGVKVHDWKLVWEKGQPLTVNLLAEINRTQFNASFSIIFKTNKVIFENTDYISYPLRYSTVENHPELAAIPTTAFLLGYYLTKVTPIPPTSMCLYPSLSDAYMNIFWWRGEKPTEPGLSVKILVKERDHLVIVTYHPELWSYRNSVETETDIYDAPQVVTAGLALCAL
jgi:hypothetical protein